MTNAVEIRGLRKAYKDFALELSLELPSGCILGLIGENGAGKTTAIKCLLGIARPDAGTVRVLGREQGRDFHRVREDVGLVLAEPSFPVALNARQVGKSLSKIYGHWDAAAYGSLLERLSVPAEKPLKELSRGNRMKVSIAAAMAHRPKLLVLDEPTSGLDPVVRDQVVEMLLDFARQEDRSVLISSHIVSDLEKLCDYIAFLKNGRLMLLEEKDRLLEEYCLVQCAAGDLAGIDPEAVRGRRETEYGVSALMLRAAVPQGLRTRPVDIEELFVFMAAGERKE